MCTLSNIVIEKNSYIIFIEVDIVNGYIVKFTATSTCGNGCDVFIKRFPPDNRIATKTLIHNMLVKFEDWIMYKTKNPIIACDIDRKDIICSYIEDNLGRVPFDINKVIDIDDINNLLYKDACAVFS